MKKECSGKKEENDEKDITKWFRKRLQEKVSLNLDLKRFRSDTQ